MKPARAQVSGILLLALLCLIYLAIRYWKFLKGALLQNSAMMRVTAQPGPDRAIFP